MAWKIKSHSQCLNNYKKYLLLGIIVLLLSTAFIYANYLIKRDKLKSITQATVTWEQAGKNLQLEIASNPLKQYEGLSNRLSLCQDCGMLFVFSDFSPKSFVMRNMNFPLDIVFINDNVIDKIYYNAPPEGSAPERIYSSDGPVNLVLELNAGEATRLGLSKGDKIMLPDIDNGNFKN
jgi:uncharacterized membrane protein (UPF0127 family)